MSRRTLVALWETRNASAVCQDCDWSARALSAPQAISRARDHCCATGHTVGLSRKQQATVSAQEATPSGDFEAMGVPEFERGSWDPRTAGPQTIESGT
jgi:hypothetical protein